MAVRSRATADNSKDREEARIPRDIVTVIIPATIE